MFIHSLACTNGNNINKSPPPPFLILIKLAIHCLKSTLGRVLKIFLRFLCTRHLRCALKEKIHLLGKLCSHTSDSVVGCKCKDGESTMLNNVS